jgi:hypothetical protein
VEKNELYIVILIVLAIVFLSVGIVMSSGLLGKPVKNNSSMTVNKTNSTDNSTSFGSPQKVNISDEKDDDFDGDSYDDYYDYYDYDYYDYYDSYDGDSGGEWSYSPSQ